MNIQFVSCIRPLPPFVAIFNTCEVNNHDDCRSLENGSFAERVLREISGTCVDTKLTGIEATCIIIGDRG